MKPTFWREILSRLHRFIPIIIIILALFARLYPGARTIDDSYITYRYARNILAGDGIVFNPGERVLGTTTPLYTLLMAALGFLFGGVNAPFPQISMSVNALADALICLTLLKLGKQFGSSTAGTAAALAWSVAPHSVTFAIGGLETSLYVLLLLGAAISHILRKHHQAAILCGLAYLTRPDALILIGLIVLDRLYLLWQEIRENKSLDREIITRAGKEIVLAIALPLAWTIFAVFYFGSPFPHSITAKTLAYQLPEGSALIRLIQHYTTPFMAHKIFGMGWVGVGLVLYPFLFINGARAAFKNNPRSWVLLAYPWLSLVVFALANPLIFRWYLTPPLPAYFLGIFLGLDTFYTAKSPSTSGVQPGPRGQVRSLSRLLLLGVLPLFSLLYSWTPHPDHGLDRAAPEMAYIKLELDYLKAAHQINMLIPEQKRSNSVIAAGDVGVLGYITGAKILDTVGLNSPETLEYYPLDPDLYEINYAVSPELILDKKPEYFVTQEVYIRHGLLTMDQFWQAYELILEIPNDIYGSDGMLIFQKK